jgi:glycosyltransferase involved in cell wall biosynthesis
MKISVLINNYNYAEYVYDAVDSVLSQTRLPSEIIVVDDGSTDDSFDRLSKAFGSETIVQIISKENGGQLSAFNTGYQLATGDLIFFLDSDDLYKETYLEEAVAFYKSNSECDFLYLKESVPLKWYIF